LDYKRPFIIMVPRHHSTQLKPNSGVAAWNGSHLASQKSCVGFTAREKKSADIVSGARQACGILGRPNGGAAMASPNR
jgi:hypothetical protein